MRVLGTAVVVGSLMLIAFGADAAQPLSPLVTDWEHYFAVQSSSTASDGRSIGTIRNTSDWGASRIQLLVEALDGSGQPVSQRVVWLGADLPPGVQAPFGVPVPQGASYRIRVFAFDLGLTGGPR